MTIIIYFILVILGLRKKKSKIIFCAILLFMWCMFTFCYGMTDDITYMNKYNNIDIGKSSTEIIYRLIIVGCNKIGFNFTGFRGVTGFISLLLIGVTIWKRAKYPNMIMLLFILCPFPIYTVQIRSMLASSVVIFAVPLLIEMDEEREIVVLGLSKQDIQFILLILIATCIHTQSLFWLLFILVRKVNTKNSIVYMLIINFMLGFIITPSFLVKIFNVFGAGNRIAEYLTLAYKLSDYRKYGPVLYIIFASIMVITSCMYILRHKKIFEYNNKIERLLNLNILMLSILSVFFRYTPEIYRIQETSLIINYLYLSNTLNKFSMSGIKKKDLKMLAFIICLCIGYLWLSVLHYMTDSVWIPFWFNNTLFEL